VELAGDPIAGLATPTVTAYEMNYAIENLGRGDAAALSAAMPVDLAPMNRRRWPGFLADLLPQGYGRAELLRRLGLPERARGETDWPLLLAGAGNPIGNLRVREAYDWLLERNPPGLSTDFTFEEVAERSDSFIEFLAQNGLFVAGSSGVQGEWPKILLTEDATGRLHLDHALPDSRARSHWLVKFGRGPDARLAQILELEAPYMKLAERLGARVHGPLTLRNRVLFIPRFDRKVRPQGVERIAQESIASLCQIADFDAMLTHDRVVEALAKVVTDPDAEIAEYVLRDALNIMLGNRDNHLRNTALQRFENGVICLSPLFDFAPMMLHPDAIARRTRWQDEMGGSPDWRRVIDQCREVTGLELPQLPLVLRTLAGQLERLPEYAAEAGITPAILDRQRLDIARVREALAGF
jgi:serine/threonine-protein kinase HipA